MTFVITGGCCNDSSCVSVCPVQAIRPRPGDPDFTTAEQLYIDPDTCIDCGACVLTCPVNAIDADWELPEHLGEFLDINAAYFTNSPIEESEPPDPVRRRLPAERPSLSVAIVGSGPAGCYAAAELSAIKGVTVTMLDRLPTPFGLVRAGVAPDHPDTKLIVKRFAPALAKANVRCLFNVEVGRDISVEELMEHHHAVLWAGGATGDRLMHVPGEDLPGSVSARQVVSWYNGHPDFADVELDLSGQKVVVIGNGNVALDIARILTRPVEDLAATDMADHAIEALRRSAVEHVLVTARRGPEHAAYSTAEVSALERLEGVSLLARAEDVAHVAELPDRRSAIVAAAAQREAGPDDKAVTLRFGLVPESINGTGAVESVTFRRGDGSLETVEASLVIRAVGFRGLPIDGLPFDTTTGTLPHLAGAVFDPVSDETVIGMYCSGWIKRGATGVIGTNKSDSAETVDSILHDFAAGRLVEPQHDLEHLTELIDSRQPNTIDLSGWRRIDQEEVSAGKTLGRARRKLVRTVDLLEAAGSTPS
jgi:ferredoxin--NADP+ reductase